MLLYEYRAIDDYGKQHRGRLEAKNENDLEKKLDEPGYYLLEAKVQSMQEIKAITEKQEVTSTQRERDMAISFKEFESLFGEDKI